MGHNDKISTKSSLNKSCRARPNTRLFTAPGLGANGILNDCMIKVYL